MVVGVNRDAARIVEALARAFPVAQQLAVGRELLDHPAEGLYDVDVALRIDRDVAGRKALRNTTHEGAVARELLDPLVGGVGDIDVALGVDGDAIGIVELTELMTKTAQLARNCPVLVNFWIRLL